MSEYDEVFDAAKRAVARELQPTVDAITDAIFLFNAVGNPAKTPTEQRFLIEQCRSMGKQLDRLVKLSGLQPSPPTEDKS